MARKLNPQQLRFISEYMSCGEGKAAAIKAGYKESGASAAAHALLKNPFVIEELDKIRQSALIIEEAKYNYKRAMEEADMAIAFARETENAAAMVKAIELKTKLSGLMIDRSEVKTAGFVINIGGMDE